MLSNSTITVQQLQNRYERALKQIDKLIQINRQQKMQVQRQRQDIQNIKNQCEAEKFKNQQIIQENENCQKQIYEMRSQYEEVERYCHKLEQSKHNHDQNDQQMKQYYEETLMEMKNKLQGYEQKVIQAETEKERIKQSYEDYIQNLKSELRVVGVLQKQNDLLKSQIIKRDQKIKQTVQNLEGRIKEQKLDQYKAKLELAYQQNDLLKAQCQELRSRELETEGMENKKKVSQYLVGLRPSQSEAMRQYANQCLAKLKLCEKSKKQYHEKYKQLKEKNKRQQKDLLVEVNKVRTLQKFIEKQQFQTKKLCDIYEKEIQNLQQNRGRSKKQQLQDHAHFTEKINQLKNILDQKEAKIVEIKQQASEILGENMELKKISQNLMSKSIPVRKEPEQRQVSKSQTIPVKPSTHRIPQEISKSITIKESSNINSSQHSKQPPKVNFMIGRQDSSNTYFPNNEGQNINYSVPHDQQNHRGNIKYVQSVNIINGINLSMSHQPKQPF